MKHCIKVIIASILMLVLASCNDTTKDISNNTYYFNTDSDKLTSKFNQYNFPWTISTEDQSYPYTNNRRDTFAFYTPNDTLFFTKKAEDTVVMNFIVSRKDTIASKLFTRSKPASYDAAYIKNNTGKYHVLSPKVHELVNIAVAMSNIGRLDSNMVEMKTPYYKKVITHFDSHSSHPLIDTLNNHLTEVFGKETYNYYYNIRMDANMFEFNAENKIINNSPYTSFAFGSEKHIDELLPLLEDFASESNFHAFYKENNQYYDSLIKDYYKLVPIDKMWKWCEEKFPDRYQCYKIYFSPLVNGAHSTQHFEDNGFAETIMFINAPTLEGDYTEKEKEAILTRVVFTEIDHNYVNPTTDRFIIDIEKVMPTLSCWNNNAQGYDSAYETFNEYMTWAINTLYLYDNFETVLFEKRIKKESETMVNRRGFIRFKEFNEFVLNWYINNPNTSFDELYRAVIPWMQRASCEDA